MVSIQFGLYILPLYILIAFFMLSYFVHCALFLIILFNYMHAEILVVLKNVYLFLFVEVKALPSLCYML